MKKAATFLGGCWVSEKVYRAYIGSGLRLIFDYILIYIIYSTISQETEKRHRFCNDGQTTLKTNQGGVLHGTAAFDLAGDVLLALVELGGGAGGAGAGVVSVG